MRKNTLYKFILQNPEKTAIAIDDLAAIYINNENYEIFSANGKAGVYYVHNHNGVVKESKLPLRGVYNVLFD